MSAFLPGSTSNIPGNTIKQVILPNQPPIISDIDNLLIRHGPISGGLDQSTNVYKLTENDLHWMRDKALADVLSEGLRQLRDQATQYGQSLELTNVYPDQNALNDASNYEMMVDPSADYPSELPHSTLTVTIRAIFRALAVPHDYPLIRQLDTVLPQYFIQNSTVSCMYQENTIVQVQQLHYDGINLIVDGKITCIR